MSGAVNTIKNVVHGDGRNALGLGNLGIGSPSGIGGAQGSRDGDVTKSDYYQNIANNPDITEEQRAEFLRAIRENNGVSNAIQQNLDMTDKGVANRAAVSEQYSALQGSVNARLQKNMITSFIGSTASRSVRGGSY